MRWTAEFNQAGIGLAGSFEQIIERVKLWESIGTDYIILSIAQNDKETQQLLAEEILPACKS